MCLAVGKMGQVRMLSWRLKRHQVSQSLWTPTFLGVPSCGFYSSGFYKFTFKFSFRVPFYAMFIPFAFITGFQLHHSFFTGTEHRVTLQLSPPQVKCWRQLLKPKQWWMQHQVLQWNLQPRKILHPFDILASLSAGPRRNKRHRAKDENLTLKYRQTDRSKFV